MPCWIHRSPWRPGVDHDTDAYYKISRAFVDGQPSGGLTRDHILDNVTLYWLTGTGASAARSYWENGQAQARAAASGQAPRRSRSRSASPRSRARASGPRAAGSSRGTPTPSTTTRSTRAGTSPRGKSRNSSRPKSGRRSAHCASWSEGTAGTTCATVPHHRRHHCYHINLVEAGVPRRGRCSPPPSSRAGQPLSIAVDPH